MKRIIYLLSAFTLILALAACSGKGVETASSVSAAQPAYPSSEEGATATPTAQNPVATVSTIAVKYDADDLDAAVSGSDTGAITLEGDSIAFAGSGATVDGSTITITAAGTYDISGALDDGQIIVDTKDEGTVVLILDGADIACSTSAPIYVLQAEKVVITLAEGTENRVTDGDSYVLADAESGEPNAAIFSKDDLTLNGKGSLTVQANYNNGIASKDDLKITGGTITVNAVNDGLKGRDSIAVKEGTITVNAGGDGLQANNDEDGKEGTIAIEGGTLNITAGLDGVQAETQLAVSGGEIAISSGGGSVNSSSRANWGNWGRGTTPTDTGSTASAKGLKAGVDVTISGGFIDIDSSDDSLHSNGSLTINGGEIHLASGDDGIHADSSVEINGGDLDIAKSYEGIESATITVNDGTIHLASSDDGFNAVGGVDGSAINGRPGQNPFDWSGDQHLYVNGGTIVVDAMGDGLDINGPIDMTGGTVLINGPTANNNGALDYAGAFNINGGLLVAVGSAGMAQAPSKSSTQYSVAHTFQSTQAAGTIVHVETTDGQDILTFVPAKSYQSIVFSAPELQEGATYVVYSGGSSTGTLTDSLYSGGTYTAGTQVASLTIVDMVTGAGAMRGGFPGARGGGMRPPGGGRHR
jgi:hypothetical protein